MLTLRSLALIAVHLSILGTPSLVRAEDAVVVVDGDTLKIGPVTYRIEGIDAPEHGQMCGSWACGNDATNRMAELVSSKYVVCQGDQADGYGRTLAVCYANGQDVGARMISEGMAWAFLKYSDRYSSQQDDARSRKVGIWIDDFQTPWDFRAERWNTPDPASPDGCPIKGNISRNGRIYHPPWSPWYEKTRINAAKGERWFCSEADAIAAGWRAPIWH